MPNPLNLVPGAVGQPRPQILFANVSMLKPAPASFSDPLYVVEPHRPDRYLLVHDWPTCHGATLPLQGADVLMAYDAHRNLRVLWWDSATTSLAPAGTAGGDLSGSFPDPSVVTVLSGQTPLAIDGTGKSLALQLLSTQKVYAQAFSFTINGLAAGTSVNTSPVNFPTAFPTAATGMLAVVQTGTATNAGLYVTSCIPNNTSTFAIDITNPALQNVSVSALAWGS